jgi:hypothetical protein
MGNQTTVSSTRLEQASEASVREYSSATEPTTASRQNPRCHGCALHVFIPPRSLDGYSGTKPFLLGA